MQIKKVKKKKKHIRVKLPADITVNNHLANFDYPHDKQWPAS